jgi:hypothetical protein
MFCRHIDVLAVSAIALGLLALSHVGFTLQLGPNAIRVENISSQLSGCPATSRLRARLEQLFNH